MRVRELQNIVVIGLTQAGERMSDPYGEDEVDLPARQYVATTLKASRSLLDASPQGEAPSHESEMAIREGKDTPDIASTGDQEDGGAGDATASKSSPRLRHSAGSRSSMRRGVGV